MFCKHYIVTDWRVTLLLLLLCSDMLGTVSDFSLRAGNSDVCIVKSSSYALQNSVTWLFSTDDSHCAKAAFAALLYQ